MRRLLAAVARRLLPAQAPVPPAHAPDGMTLYGIGDVHGERALLEALLDAIRRDIADRAAADRVAVVFLGDYVDRGPDSRGVLDILLRRPMGDADHRFLLGNHEQAMLDFLRDPEGGAGWLGYGGLMTADSYGVRAAPPMDAAGRAAFRDALAAAMPSGHKAFLEGLETAVVYGDYAFVHAGVRPGRRLADQSSEDLLWIREPFLDWKGPFEKRVVHGHTIRPAPEVLPNRIGIDTGAYATGTLTAVALSGRTVRVIQARR